MTYRVLTWDAELGRFTPDVNVPPGPYTKWQLRRALRRLAACGYDVKRSDAPAVLVERIDGLTTRAMEPNV